MKNAQSRCTLHHAGRRGLRLRKTRDPSGPSCWTDRARLFLSSHVLQAKVNRFNFGILCMLAPDGCCMRVTFKKKKKK